MSRAIRIFQGRFGRVALLDMAKPLVAHAHHHCHVLIKISGPDTFFVIRGESQPLMRDTAVLVNAWELHSYAYHAPNMGDTILLALYIEPTWLAQIQNALTVSGHPNFFPHPCVPLASAARRLADDLAAQMLVSNRLEPERLENLLFELMMVVIDRNSEWRNFGELLRASRSQLLDQRIRKAMSLMRKNIGDDQDYVTIAAQCGLSRAHFFALFRQCTNLTPSVYTNVLRMEAAIREMTEGNSTLAGISLDLGFSAQSHFTRFFREHLGIPPSEYRRIVDVMQNDSTQP